MEVIAVWIAARRLMKDPGGSKDGLGRALVARGIAQKPDLELVGAEEPFHARLVVHDQGAHEVPIARFVEAEHPAAEHREPEAIEREPAVAIRRQAAGVSREEQEIGIPPGAMSAMPIVRAAMGAREITDPKWVSSWKSVGYFTRRAFDRANERPGPVSRSLFGTEPLIARPTVSECSGIVQVSPIRSADRDRLPSWQRLCHAGTARHDSHKREKPQHFRCMIAYGSA